MPEIILEHVTKRWGNFYGVDDVSLNIPDNSFITLLGPSGCGKTTILRMIAGLETPTEGRILIGDQVVFDSATGVNIPPNRRNVGFLFQNYALWPNMTVYENISFGLKNIRKNGRKLTKEEIDERVQAVSRVVKIGMFMDRYPAELSGGQQQRVAIARTLAPGPQVLFMDEPLSNLDAKLRLEMRYELQRLHVETGSTFVYVTHDQMEAMTLATKICLINNGVLQQFEAPLTVYDRPANTFVGDFVGNPSMNFADAKGTPGGNGKLTLSVWDGCRAVFRPNEPLDIRAWQRQRDIDAEEFQKKETERFSKKGAVEKSNKDELFDYHIHMVDEPEEKPGGKSEATDDDFVLGIRPEDIHLEEKGGIPVTIYGAMPTGMESTLKLRTGRYLLTAVIFGSAMFTIGQEEHMIVKGNDILLFDKKSGKLISAGSLELIPDTNAAE